VLQYVAMSFIEQKLQLMQLPYQLMKKISNVCSN